jgi:hypothetical protein
MNCCGNKRKDWLNELKSPNLPETSGNSLENEIADKPDKTFEFTGKGSMKIQGIATGNLYHFKFFGDKQTVDYSDSFAMMAERYLKVSK